VEVHSVEAIVRGLNEAGVRYLIAGGLAVVAHGYQRLTADVDLILDLEEANLRKAVAVFDSLGFKPRAPVPLEQFANAAARQSWVRDKRAKVFSLLSDLHPRTEVDLFVEAPFDFVNAYQNAANLTLAGTLTAPFVSLDDLLYLKRQANRPRDLEDIRNLERLRNARE
jgi:predicted nucleotidyltransferase